jgi:hypothetical protein
MAEPLWIPGEPMNGSLHIGLYPTPLFEIKD